MHKIKVVVGLMVSALLALTMTVTAQAESLTFSGTTVNAGFLSTDPSGCIQTTAFISVVELTHHEPPNPKDTSPSVQVNLYKFDSCTFTTLLFAFGDGTVPEEAFQAKQLASATLNATLQVTDFTTGGTLDVELALTWTGTGETDRSGSRSYFHGPGHIAQSRFKGSSRDAVASGNISFAGTSLAVQSTSAMIGVTKGGHVEIFN